MDPMDPMDPMDRHGLKRPPTMGEMKRVADAQALTLRPELRAAMAAQGLSAEDVARLARLDRDTLNAFLGGASINPRWQERLARWLLRADDPPPHAER